MKMTLYYDITTLSMIVCLLSRSKVSNQGRNQTELRGIINLNFRLFCKVVI